MKGYTANQEDTDNSVYITGCERSFTQNTLACRNQNCKKRTVHFRVPCCVYFNQQVDWYFWRSGTWTKYRVIWELIEIQISRQHALNNQLIAFPRHQVKAKSRHFWLENLECMNKWGVLLKKQTKATWIWDRKNWRISYSALIFRGNQKLFPWSALEMAPGLTRSWFCPNLSIGTLSVSRALLSVTSVFSHLSLDIPWHPEEQWH